ncbi:MAG: FAD-dependent oxidoreductase, partial [Melioribacteraceae bacterium]|nr:FAD-dependent oxidoreductase [Melioribacteraceae bacterium]
MKKILIIGGGLSGLSSALYLTEMGFQVEIVEASPKLGGRTYSFVYKGKNRVIDNGQHILMGCYSHTLDYINKIRSKDKFYFQDSLQINYASPDNKIYNLSVPEKFYPLNFLYSFINFKLLTFNERKEVFKFLFRLEAIQKQIRNDQSVKDLLSANGQSSSTIKTFWELVVISAINTPIEIASAELFVE